MKSISEKIEFVRAVFGESALANNGTDIAVKCPSCGEKSSKKKLSINLNSWQYHCWVCGIKGRNLSSILRKHFNRDIVLFYEKDFNIKSFSKNNDEVIEEKCVVLPEGFIFLADNFNSRDPDIRSTISYCKKRGLSERDFWRFRLGTTSSGKFRRRVIVPSFDYDGDLNYFVARSIDSETKPKYTNAPVRKTDIVFNEIDINWSKEITIVEGPFDLMKCDTNATCLLGSEVTEGSLLFKRIVSHKTPVLLALDNDMIEKQAQVAKIFSKYCCNVRIANLMDCHDVGEMTAKEFQKMKKNAKEFSSDLHLIWKIRSIESGSII